MPKFNPFKGINFIALQQPLIMVVAMVTGQNIHEILRLNVHERLKLILAVFVQLVELLEAAVAGTDPAGPGGVTLTEDEVNLIVDEADDPGAAVVALLDSFKGGEDAAETEPVSKE